ncbi:Protein of unknown function [Streptomyces zhaozhouensis]|uniref:DUF2848 domain-containing protein n=1 Tax=Streptomyces zhaozhouensis TaxID=1300267 RepID=A0A286DNX5_9ACTN|nr:DUF2848 family protein [Streptomyces zhaozhouensis]SOD60395.1 Protein of unknown function [Streptomyces zhaozhouensis]
MSTNPLTFTVAGTGEVLRVEDFDLVVAGYTGRDESAVRAHIEELAAIGVPEPDSVPAFYPLDARLAVQDEAITVAGGYTSGEVEPVLIRAGGRLLLGVGSDHTDRDMERESVARSKAACPKPLSRVVVELPEAGLDWDAVQAECAVDGREYQRGALAALRVPTELLALPGAPAAARDLVLFCGTLPLLDGAFVAGAAWSLALRLPDGTALRHRYTVEAPVGG